VKPSSIAASTASTCSPKPRRHDDLLRGVHRRRQLLREEWITRRRALDRGEHAGTQRPTGGSADDRRECRAVEGAERDLHRRAALEQAGAQTRGRVGKRLIADPDDEHQALAGGAATKMVNKRRRRLPGGVQVVDREDDAAVRRGLPQQLGDRREDAMALHGLPVRLGGWANRRQDP
jgi:hypothetical protein